MTTLDAPDTAVLQIAHIVRSPGILGGKPRIAGRRVPVHHLIYDHLTTGVAVEELMIAFDLTAAQIYAALAYYYDHSEEIDRLISEELEAFASLPDDPSQAELRARWEARLRSAPIPDPDQEMTVSEVAEVYGVTPQAVRAAAKRGALPARKSGSAWLIRRRDADYRWGRGSP